MEQKGINIIKYGFVVSIISYLVPKLGISLLVNLIASITFALGIVAMVVGLIVWITGSIQKKGENKNNL